MTITAKLIADLIDTALSGSSLTAISLRKSTEAGDTFSDPVYRIESIAITEDPDLSKSNYGGEATESWYFESDFTIGIDWPDSGGNHGMGAIQSATCVELIATAIKKIKDQSISQIKFIGSSNMGNSRGIVKTTMTFSIKYWYK